MNFKFWTAIETIIFTNGTTETITHDPIMAGGIMERNNKHQFQKKSFPGRTIQSSTIKWEAEGWTGF